MLEGVFQLNDWSASLCMQGRLTYFILFSNSRDLAYKERLKLFIFLILINLQSSLFDSDFKRLNNFRIIPWLKRGEWGELCLTWFSRIKEIGFLMYPKQTEIASNIRNIKNTMIFTWKISLLKEVKNNDLPS